MPRRMAGVPYVLSVRRSLSSSVLLSRPSARREFEEALVNARRVITPSRVAARNLLASDGFESVVVPDGVDTERLRAVPARRVKPLVVCPSFDVEQDDLNLLVDAFAQVASQVQDAQLAITGPLGPRALGDLIARLPEHMRGQLLVLEKADRKRVLALFGRASLTCVPSPTESSSKAVVESLAIGTPVVCADGGAAAEVIDEDAVAVGAGVRFRAGDVDGCAEEMFRVIERSGSDEVVEGCRARGFLFDWSFVGPRLVELYRQAADPT